MVTLSSHPKQISLSSTSTLEDVVSHTSPLTLSSVHQLWTQALSLNPPSASRSLSHLKSLLRTLNLLPRPLLTPAQTAPLYLNIALLFAFLGDYFLAAESFHKAVELDENSAIGWHGLGGMKFLLGDWKAARKAWKTCLACLDSQQTLKYRMWILDGSGAETEKGRNRKEWVLEKARVEWNLSFSVLRNKGERKLLQEKVWSFAGVPAGMAFGPSFSTNSVNLYDAKEKNGLDKGHVEGAKANASQHTSTNIPLANTRTSSHAMEISAKPLPALPDHISLTQIPPPRAQKGLSSLSRLFTKPRASSASKTQALKPKRPQLPIAPLTCNDLSTALPVIESFTCASSSTRAGTMLCSKFQKIETFGKTATTNPDFFDKVFDTDSGSDLDADELKYYFSTQPESAIALNPLPPSTRLYRPGQIQYQLMEMRDEIRLEMQERYLSSQVAGRTRSVSPTKVDDKEGKKATTVVENKELNKIAPAGEKEVFNGTVTKIKYKESEEGVTKVEDKKWDRTAFKAEENKRNGFARNLQLEHKDTETKKVDIGKNELRERSERKNTEPQTTGKGRGAEKKKVLETVLETSTAAESQATEKNNHVRGRSERRNVENHAAVKGRKAEKEKTLDVSTSSESHQAEEKNEVRGSSKRRNLESRSAMKGREKQKEKVLEVSTAASQKVKERMPTRKEPEKPEPAKTEPIMQEPELEYLKPVRFEGFNGEWREKDLEYEAEARMAKEKLNGGK